MFIAKVFRIIDRAPVGPGKIVWCHIDDLVLVPWVCGFHADRGGEFTGDRRGGRHGEHPGEGLVRLGHLDLEAQKILAGTGTVHTAQVGLDFQWPSVFFGLLQECDHDITTAFRLYARSLGKAEFGSQLIFRVEQQAHQPGARIRANIPAAQHRIDPLLDELIYPGNVRVLG